MTTHSWLLQPKTAANVPKIIQQLGPKLKAHWDREFAEEESVDAAKIVEYLLEQDKSPTKEYTLWLATNYANGGIQRWEDIRSRATIALQVFDALKKAKKLPADQRDVMRLKGLSALEDLVERFDEVDTTSNRQKDAQREKEFFERGDAKLVYNDAQVKVVVPDTHEASCYFGVNTKWCTTSKEGEMFDSYSNQGDLYIVLIKAENKRYQFFFRDQTIKHDPVDEDEDEYNEEEYPGQNTPLDNQFMNERDEPINPNALADQYPVLWKIFTPIAQKTNNLALNARPSPELQQAAVERDGLDIQLIKNPSERLKMLAVTKNGMALQFIPNPSAAIQFAAVRGNGEAIQFIDNPSERLQLIAVGGEQASLFGNSGDGEALKYIKNPSPLVQWTAVSELGRNIRLIDNPSEELQFAAVRSEWHAIDFIDNPSEELQLAAVKSNARAIEFIKNPTEQVQLLAVTNNPRMIKNIVKPLPSVIEKAIEEDPELVDYAQVPYDERDWD